MLDLDNILINDVEYLNQEEQYLVEYFTDFNREELNKINVAIAEKIFGWTYQRKPEDVWQMDAVEKDGLYLMPLGDWRKYYRTDPASGYQDISCYPKNYSESMSEAWKVVERTEEVTVDGREGRFVLTNFSEGIWTVGWENRNNIFYELTADSAPAAICLAALWARGITPEELLQDEEELDFIIE